MMLGTGRATREGCHFPCPHRSCLDACGGVLDYLGLQMPRRQLQPIVSHICHGLCRASGQAVMGERVPVLRFAPPARCGVSTRLFWACGETCAHTFGSLRGECAVLFDLLHQEQQQCKVLASCLTAAGIPADFLDMKSQLIPYPPKGFRT